MNERTKQLLGYMLEDEEDQYMWINSHNTVFDMSPQKMIDEGREPEVQSYLHYAVYGPY